MDGETKTHRTRIDAVRASTREVLRETESVPEPWRQKVRLLVRDIERELDDLERMAKGPGQTKDPLEGALAARFATETEIANGTAKRCERCRSKWCAFRGEAHCYVMCWDYQDLGDGSERRRKMRE